MTDPMTSNTTNSPQQIEACPFCKSEDVHYQSDYGDESQFVCAVCDARGPMRRSYADALTAWNTRPSPQSDTREAVALADETDWHVLAQDIANYWQHPEERAVAYQAAGEAIKVLRSTPNAGTEMLLREAREALCLFPEAYDVLTAQEMRDAKGNWRSLIDQQTNALKIIRTALAKIDASQSPTGDDADLKACENGGNLPEKAGQNEAATSPGPDQHERLERPHG